MKSEESRIVKRLSYYITLLAAVLLTACAGDEATDNEQPLPEGMGRIRITICTPESASTRSVGGDLQSPTRAVNATPWEDPDHEWERLQTFRIFICKASNNEIVQIKEGSKTDMSPATTLPSTYKSATVTSDPLEAGYYHIFATANYADGYSVGDIIDLDRTVKFTNGYSETYIPMTGKLTTTPGGNDLMNVEVSSGSLKDVTNTPLTVWRVMGKMQFYFTNESAAKVKIKGIEVNPLNLASSSGPGIYLFSKDVLTSTDNLAAGGITLPTGATTDVGTFRYEPSTPLELNATNGTGNIFFYVNETDATFTTINNQLSLRFKIARQKPDNSWYDDEIRYGMTTNYASGSGGFNVIRRNDWIHIPVTLTDWQFRIEPIAFVPIAGYPAIMHSSDALTATFSTGGYIILKPYIQKNSDGTWRDFSDPEVTFVSVHWTNSDGTDVVDNGTEPKEIVKTAFAYDSANYCITGELNNDLGAGTYKTTLTVNVTLGPSSGTQYDYSFTCNVVLQK
jgi:hypothetical protein